MYHIKNIASMLAISLVSTFAMIEAYMIHKIYLGVIACILLVIYQWMIFGRD